MGSTAYALKSPSEWTFEDFTKAFGGHREQHEAWLEGKMSQEIAKRFENEFLSGTLISTILLPRILKEVLSLKEQFRAR